MPDFVKGNYFQRIRDFLSENVLWFIIAFGIVLYLRQYLFDRSLWLDEAMLSLNIIRYPIPDFLHQPLPYHNQAAPFGFLVIEKFAICLFGTSEYALRLFPLISGAVSLWLFSLMAKIYLPRQFLAFAMICFSINPALAYYSSEVKPYYCDVLFMLLAFVFIAQSCLNEFNLNRILILGLLGAVIIWFSFPVVFVLAGIAMTLVLFCLIQKEWGRITGLIIITSFWFISFILNYVVLLHHIHLIKGNEGFWQSGYISFFSIKSWLTVFNDVLCYPLGFSNVSWFAGLLFFLGGFSFFKEDKRKFFFLLAPLFFVFLASGLHQYSCKEREVLFLVPIFLVLIINGVRMVSLKTRKFKIITAILLASILFYSPLISIWDGFIKPENKQDVRHVLSYIKSHSQEGDIYCIYSAAIPAVEYYSPLFGLPIVKAGFLYLETYVNLDAKKKDLDKLPNNRRVWLIFSEILFHGEMKDDDLCIKYLLGSGGNWLISFPVQMLRVIY